MYVYLAVFSIYPQNVTPISSHWMYVDKPLKYFLIYSFRGKVGLKLRWKCWNKNCANLIVQYWWYWKSINSRSLKFEMKKEQKMLEALKGSGTTCGKRVSMFYCFSSLGQPWPHLITDVPQSPCNLILTYFFSFLVLTKSFWLEILTPSLHRSTLTFRVLSAFFLLVPNDSSKLHSLL